jgi:outer membrane protein
MSNLSLVRGGVGGCVSGRARVVFVSVLSVVVVVMVWGGALPALADAPVTEPAPAGAPALVMEPAPALVFAEGDEVRSVDEVVRAAIAYDATLRVSVTEHQRAQLAVTREDERLTTVLTATAGYTYGNVSTRARDGGVRLLARNALNTSAGVARTFAPGTTAAATVNVDRSVDDSIAVGNLGAGYNVGLRLEVTQPWLRGFGEDVVLSGLATARVSAQDAAIARDRAASALLREVLSAYWELWYAQQAVAVRAEGLALSEQSLEVGELRVSAGAIAADDLLPLLTDIAAVEEEVAAAHAEVEARAVALSRYVGLSERVRASADAPALASLAAFDGAQARVQESAYELKQLRASIASSRVPILTAEDAARWRLDTTAWIQVGGAGYGPGQSLEQFFSLGGTTAYLGLRLEAPLDGASQGAEAQRAYLAVTAAQERLEAAQARLDADAAARLTALQTAYRRLTLAERTAALARDSVASQQRKWRAGATTLIDVARVLQQQREADLRVLRARADIAIGHVALDDLQGSLLDRFDIQP